MKEILIKINKLNEEIQRLKPVDLGLRKSLQERLRVEWTYNSNAIEGNTLTFGETAFFLREGLTSEGRPLKDYLEVRNHAEAIDGLQDIVARKRNLTEGLIKELHAVLLKGVEATEALGMGGQRIQKPVTPGQYKKRPNHVLTLSGKIHHYADPLHVRDEMERLLDWYHQAKEIHPVERGAIFHHRFVAIHPFDDGNGRMARILMNLILMQERYPPCIIQMRHRRRYLESLEKTDVTGKTEVFVAFVAQEMLSTLETILNIMRGGDVGLPAIGKAMDATGREQQILEVMRQGTFPIGQIHALLPQIKRPTLKSDLQRLVRLKKIQNRGVGKGVVYFI